jgi:RNA polymerase sigma factor (sigma-70 family)
MHDIPELSRLANDARWLRALARSLVADAASAEDLAQDTWLAALRSGALAGGIERSWFRVVLRRRLFETKRESAARLERESKASRPEELPSTLDLVERAASQRDLVQAVLELDEPYRSTILWRFFEDLPARAIARRANVPVATVHTRLSRALDKLRARLGRDHGDEAATLAWLVPLTSARVGTLGAWMMKTSTKIAIAAVALVSTLAVWSIVRNTSAPRVAPADTALVQPTQDARVPEKKSPPLVEGSEPARRDPVNGAAANPGATESAATASSIRLRGLVLDASGHLLPGVRLATRPDHGTSFTSGADGRFAITLAHAAMSVVAADPRYSTVLSGAGATQGDSIVVVAPRIDLAGTVADENGTRLQGVVVSIALPKSFGADFGHPLDAALDQRWTSTTDSEGKFTLAGVPSVAGADLTAVLGAFAPHREPLPLAGAQDLWIVLQSAGAASTKMHGIVLDPYGNRMNGARVAFGKQTVFTDAGGRFEVDAAEEPNPLHIIALMSGFQPAILQPEDGRWPSEIVLQLGGPPLSMSGSVLDEHDQPVPSARVWISDPTPFGLVENEPLHVEALVAGDDHRFWAWVETDARGKFRLDGLLARDYGVAAVDMRTLLQAETRASAGRNDVVIRMPKGELLPIVRGHVVSFAGDGIPNVPVDVQRPGFTAPYPGGGTRDEFSSLPAVLTDKDGAFEFHDVPRKGVELFANGESILFAAVAIEDVADPLDVKIRAHLRRHLQVEIAPPLDRADEVRVLDAQGAPMILRIMRGSTSLTNRKADIVEGRTQVLSLSDEARNVVLYKSGAEVGRVAVSLTGSDVQTVRW